MIRNYLRGGDCQIGRLEWPLGREEICYGEMSRRVERSCRFVDGEVGKARRSTLNKSRSSERINEEGAPNSVTSSEIERR